MECQISPMPLTRHKLRRRDFPGVLAMKPARTPGYPLLPLTRPHYEAVGGLASHSSSSTCGHFHLASAISSWMTSRSGASSSCGTDQLLSHIGETYGNTVMLSMRYGSPRAAKRSLR